MLIEGQERSISNGCFTMPMDGFDPANTALAKWHNFPVANYGDTSRLWFADGYAQRKQSRDPRTLAAPDRTGDLDGGQPVVNSPDNPDLRWLQERTDAGGLRCGPRCSLQG